jgi:hypothetical protein
MTETNIINSFPWTVIEYPKPSMKLQEKVAMRTASKAEGGIGYEGPTRDWPARWKHTSDFYVLEPVDMGVYLARSLNDSFHYQILKSEEAILDHIKQFCKSNPKSKIHVVSQKQNYHDSNITVIHNPSHKMKTYIESLDDHCVVDLLLEKGSYDESRGNYKIDSGYASSKSQTRGPSTCYIS